LYHSIHPSISRRASVKLRKCGCRTHSPLNVLKNHSMIPFYCRFDEAAEPSKKPSRVEEALGRIAKLYCIEGELWVQLFEPQEFIRKRKEHALPVLTDFKRWLDKKAPQVPPSTLLGRVVSYTLGGTGEAPIVLPIELGPPTRHGRMPLEGGEEMSEENKETPQRWTTKRKAALILSVLKGETSLAEAARTHGLTVAELEGWKDRFLMGAENALRTRPREECVFR
jgi:hypothetical protein